MCWPSYKFKSYNHAKMEFIQSRAAGHVGCAGFWPWYRHELPVVIGMGNMLLVATCWLLVVCLRCSCTCSLPKNTKQKYQLWSESRQTMMMMLMLMVGMGMGMVEDARVRPWGIASYHISRTSNAVVAESWLQHMLLPCCRKYDICFSRLSRCEGPAFLASPNG